MTVLCLDCCTVYILYAYIVYFASDKDFIKEFYYYYYYYLHYFETLH